jgi:hypothetical protein
VQVVILCLLILIHSILVAASQDTPKEACDAIFEDYTRKQQSLQVLKDLGPPKCRYLAVPRTDMTAVTEHCIVLNQMLPEPSSSCTSRAQQGAPITRAF